jgi:hypothetical protein
MATKYVRLPDRLATGSLSDVNSGWSIGGLDVRPVPDEKLNPVAYAFVQGYLRTGHLEEASKAEHDEVRELDRELAKAHLGTLDEFEAAARGGYQEGTIQQRVTETQSRIKSSRATVSESSDEDDEETEEGGDYSTMSKADLVAEAENRGLDSSGTKADIVARLEEADAAE